MNIYRWYENSFCNLKLVLMTSSNVQRRQLRNLIRAHIDILFYIIFGIFWFISFNNLISAISLCSPFLLGFLFFSLSFLFRFFFSFSVFRYMYYFIACYRHNTDQSPDSSFMFSSATASLRFSSTDFSCIPRVYLSCKTAMSLSFCHTVLCRF